MHRYKLLAPFRVSDDTIAQPGTEIELEDDIARLHADKLQRLPDPEPASQAAAAHDATGTAG